jgi:hypothetical protein
MVIETDEIEKSRQQEQAGASAASVGLRREKSLFSWVNLPRLTFKYDQDRLSYPGMRALPSNPID